MAVAWPIRREASRTFGRNILMLTNPWLMLGVCIALTGSFIAGTIHGHRAEKNTWQRVAAQQQAEAARVLAESERARNAQERAYNAFKDKVENEHAAAAARIDAAYDTNRELLAELGGLRDRYGRCRANGLPASAASAGGTSDTAAGCELSGKTSQALLKLARDADTAAAYAAACHAWALKIGQ
jgi:hypothetical protein